jgi:hypothetical protein
VSNLRPQATPGAGGFPNPFLAARPKVDNDDSTLDPDLDSAIRSVEDELLAQDRTSTQGWARRAVGVEAHEAMATAPRNGLLQTSMPIEVFRALQAHIRRTGLTQAAWARRAVLDQWARQGGPAALIAQGRRHGQPT